jgi:hypothetical protein
MVKKIIKVGVENMNDNDEMFKNINFNQPTEIAYGFGKWLNLYFECVSSDFMWYGKGGQIYTTKDLLIEFIHEYNNIPIQNIQDEFDNMIFNDQIKLALDFGEWLNMYFKVWSPNRSTWMDVEEYAYTTEELLDEFINK